MFLFVFVEHATVQVAMAVFGFLWEIALLLVYFRFVIENRKHWIAISFAAILIYILSCVYCNYKYHKTIPN